MKHYTPGNAFAEQSFTTTECKSLFDIQIAVSYTNRANVCIRCIYIYKYIQVSPYYYDIYLGQRTMFASHCHAANQIMAWYGWSATTASSLPNCDTSDQFVGVDSEIIAHTGNIIPVFSYNVEYCGAQYASAE